MAEATKKKDFSNQRVKSIEGGINQSKEVLVTTEEAAKAVFKSYPPLENVGTKPLEHANVQNIFKENNVDYSHIVFPCPLNNCRSGESLSFTHLLYCH